MSDDKKWLLLSEAEKTIESLQQKVKQLQCTLDGVMYLVDKWLPEEGMKMDEVNRAAKAREVALQAIETLEHEKEQLRAQVQKLNATINRAAEFLGENRGCPPDCDKIDCDSFESCQHCWSSWLMGGMDDAGIS